MKYPPLVRNDRFLRNCEASTGLSNTEEPPESLASTLGVEMRRLGWAETYWRLSLPFLSPGDGFSRGRSTCCCGSAATGLPGRGSGPFRPRPRRPWTAWGWEEPPAQAARGPQLAAADCEGSVLNQQRNVACHVEVARNQAGCNRSGTPLSRP